METPRPTIDVENLEWDSRLAKKRATRMRRRIGGQIREANKVIRVFRNFQKKLLPKDWEDPSPYQYDYIFYTKYYKSQSELDVLRNMMLAWF